MRKTFVLNLIIMMGVNLLIKPFWILGIDRAVQNRLGFDAYGQYYGHIIKDKSIADNIDKAKKHFKVKSIKKNTYWNDLKARVKKEKLQS